MKSKEIVMDAKYEHIKLHTKSNLINLASEIYAMANVTGKRSGYAVFPYRKHKLGFVWIEGKCVCCVSSLTRTGMLFTDLEADAEAFDIMFERISDLIDEGVVPRAFVNMFDEPIELDGKVFFGSVPKCEFVPTFSYNLFAKDDFRGVVDALVNGNTDYLDKTLEDI